MTEYKKKLIEVALPLEAINRESAREKSIRHGHPSTMHVWWSRKPLATCRAVLFASLVDDPSAHPREFPTDEAQETERQRLFRIIEDLVKWENSTNETVLDAARAEIVRSSDGNLPPVVDPFSGGGSISLEAQRLGLEACAGDLNPVAVLLTKALIEIPPAFANMAPVNPEAHAKLGDTGWSAGEGLAEDVRYYGRWMRDRAEERLGHLYPKVTLPTEHGGGQATAIAQLWSRAVKCPNPACGAEIPLASKWTLSTKKGERVWVEPIVNRQEHSVRLEVRSGTGTPPEPPKVGHGATFRCLVCGSIADGGYIKAEGSAGRMGSRSLAIVAKGPKKRVYLSCEGTSDSRDCVAPPWRLEGTMSTHPQYMGTPSYGLTEFRDLFTPRQLVTLATFSDLVIEAGQRIAQDLQLSLAVSRDGYVDAVTTYLTLAVGKATSFHNTLARWRPGEGKSAPAFGRQAIPIVWDYAEVNPFAGAGGDWMGIVEGIATVIDRLPAHPAGSCVQRDAAAGMPTDSPGLFSTDPPYYDNIPYADLSDFFYVWLRRTIPAAYADVGSTLLTPKAQELVADVRRHEGADGAKSFFEAGLLEVFKKIKSAARPDYPVTIYYGFKQSEQTGEGADSAYVSTGWETLLSSLLSSGLRIVGTWPFRSEMATRMRSMGSNALASSVVLVCRRREDEAPLASRREFLAALRADLPDALRHLQRGSIAPVDLAQASIGPGMAVFSRYSKVIEADGSPMSVRTALALINQALDEVVAEQEGEFDADTRWAIAWFQEAGMEVGDFGRAELLSRAKNTAVAGMVEAGILEAKAGKVRLLRREELDEGWDPATDKRLTVWEMTQHLIRRLDEGESAAGALVRQLGANAEVARDLAYRLYLICERKKWAQEALAYNALVVAWPEIQRLAASEPASAGPSQTSFEV